MLKKRLYMTVKERKQYKALSKQYGINEHQLHHQHIIKPEQKRSATKVDKQQRNA